VDETSQKNIIWTEFQLRYQAESPYLAGMSQWLEEIFPEYAPPRFNKLLTQLRHANGRHEIQIFVGLMNEQVVGLMQMFYREWQHGSWQTLTCWCVRTILKTR
jgi:hypothetical protein